MSGTEPDTQLTVQSWWRGLLGLLRSWVSGPVAVPLDEAVAPRAVGTVDLPDLEPPTAVPTVERPSEHVRICIDFGTSTSTVARAVLGGEPELAILQADPRSGRRYPTIDSDIAWTSGEAAVLGAAARLLEERGGMRPGTEYHRSLKRMLSDLRRLPESHVMLQIRVGALVEELLRLALDPASSGTLARQAALLGVPVADVARDVGLPNRQALVESVAKGVLDVYLCVPNAFGNFEEEVLRGAAWRAAQAFQDSVTAARSASWTDEGPRPTVAIHLIREAKAVAWWVLHGSHLRGRDTEAMSARWLIYDVGAGSTDAAIVSVRTGARPGDSPEVRSQAYSGASFGGHDVDELFLRLCAERAGEVVPDGIARRIKAGGTTRSQQLRMLADAKETWSREIADAIVRGDPGLVARLVQWFERPDGPMPGADMLPAFRPSDDLWPEVREIAGNAWGADYARFVRGVAIGVLRALETAEPGVAVDRVVLSGRGALLPGVRGMVTARLLATGRIHSPDQVQLVDGDGTGDTDRLKLACVLGIAVAASHAAIPEELPQTLAEDITIGRNVSLWSRGTRMHDRAVRAGVRLDGHEGSRRIGFYQYRCPREVAEAIGAESLWEQRHLGGAEIHVFEPIELHATFDSRSAQIQVWRTGASGPIPVRLEVDPVLATGQNPVTRLPFGWVDG